MRRRLVVPRLLILFSLFLGAWTTPATAAEEALPRVVVETFQARLLAVMKQARALGPRGRYERLTPAIEDAFHMPLITQVVTGIFWKSANRQQRPRLVAAFKRMSISTLATLFDDYSGQVFETVGDKPERDGVRVVETRLVDPDASFVDIAYVVKSIRGRWYIVDVVVDHGISELKTRRSDYRRILKDKGVEGLIAALTAKADQLITP